MRVVRDGGETKVWLSAADTYRWAHRSGQRWPLSDLSGHRLFAALDRHGDLVELTVDGRDAPDDLMANELDAILEDAIGSAHLRADEPLRRGSWRRDRSPRHRSALLRERSRHRRRVGVR